MLKTTELGLHQLLRNIRKRFKIFWLGRTYGLRATGILLAERVLQDRLSGVTSLNSEPIYLLTSDK